MSFIGCDLHIHSYYSDGTYLPKEIVQKAISRKLPMISITDHDEVGCIKPAKEEVKRLGAELKIITGAEMTSYDETGREVHILAYGFDEEDKAVLDYLQVYKDARVKRIEKIISILQEQGLEITLEDVKKYAKGSSMGRLHLAKAMVHKAIVSNTSAAFALYLGNDCVAYVPKMMIPPEKTIEEIHDWGGVAILAHPYYFNKFSEIEKYVEYGIDGFEAYYSRVDKKLRKDLKRIARKYDKLLTGGSDTHGGGLGRPDVGGTTVPYHFAARLLERLK